MCGRQRKFERLNMKDDMVRGITYAHGNAWWANMELVCPTPHASMYTSSNPPSLFFNGHVGRTKVVSAALWGTIPDNGVVDDGVVDDGVVLDV